MTKDEILRTLHAMISERLFKSGQEPASRTELEALREKLEALGLDEPVPGAASGTRRPTQLGKEINLQLMQAFLSEYWAFGIPEILYTNGLISADEEDRIMDVLNEMVEEEEKMWRALLPLLRQAFERANLMGLF
jgi:hypothetical protein